MARERELDFRGRAVGAAGLLQEVVCDDPGRRSVNADLGPGDRGTEAELCGGQHRAAEAPGMRERLPRPSAGPGAQGGTWGPLRGHGRPSGFDLLCEFLAARRGGRAVRSASRSLCLQRLPGPRRGPAARWRVGGQRFRTRTLLSTQAAPQPDAVPPSAGVIVVVTSWKMTSSESFRVPWEGRLSLQRAQEMQSLIKM